MFTTRLRSASRARDEAEKPFWISFADLMTALMVLFLVVMSVALLAVTKTVSDLEREDKEHNKDIETILGRFEDLTKEPRFAGITIDRQRHVIDFGTQAQFPFRESTLTSEQQKLLRSFVPAVLEKANDDLGKRVLKRIAVDGYTDKKGSYLSNLNLSLNRSQRVLCTLFAAPLPGEQPLSFDQLEQIRALFMVGGYSFNASKDTDEQSRRVEMRLEFLGVKEQRSATDGIAPANFGTCALVN